LRFEGDVVAGDCRALTRQGACTCARPAGTQRGYPGEATMYIGGGIVGLVVVILIILLLLGRL
jgi:hypothetical protein